MKAQTYGGRLRFEIQDSHLLLLDGVHVEEVLVACLPLKEQVVFVDFRDLQ